MLRAHLTGFLALLAPLSSAPSNVPVVTGAADSEDQAPALPANRPERFIVVRPDSMPVDSGRLAQYSGNLNGRLYVTCVGRTVEQVQWLQEKSRALLVDKRPVVTGRSVAPLKVLDGSPVTVDRDVQPSVLYAVDVYQLFSA